MKRVLVTVVGVGLLAAQVGAAETAVLTTDKDKVSYSLGADIGRSFRKQALDVDLELLMKGLRDGLSGERLLLPEKELRAVVNGVQAEVRRKMALNRRVAAEENKKEGEAFLSANKTKEGVVTLPSGVQYKILKAGTGKKPTDADMVECNYRGTLLDGTEFDATPEGKPSTLKVAALVAGWREAMKRMEEGAKWQIVVPSALAYGARGVGNDIGPNETLLYEVELVRIK